jgi:hypothetical protein
MRLYTQDPKKNKKVLCGHIRENKFFRIVKPEHFMRVVGGYGIQEGAFEQLLEHKVNTILLVEPKKVWKSKLQDWFDHGRVADYGHGKQRFLGIKYMKGIKYEADQ